MIERVESLSGAYPKVHFFPFERGRCVSNGCTAEKWNQTVSWSTGGQQSIADAKLFRDALTMAIEEAEKA